MNGAKIGIIQRQILGMSRNSMKGVGKFMIREIRKQGFPKHEFLLFYKIHFKFHISK